MYTHIIKIINLLSVKVQVISITILSLIGIITIAFGAYYTSVSVSESTENSISASEKVNSLDNIDKLALEMLRYEKDYIANFSENNIEQYNISFTSALRVSTELLNEIGNKEKKKLLSEIIDGFNAISIQFDKVVELRNELGLDETHGLVGNLNKSVVNIDKKTDQLKNSVFNPAQIERLSLNLYGLRLFQKDFMLTGNTVFLSQYQNALVSLDKNIEKVQLTRKEKRGLISVIQKYKDNFKIWSESKDDYNHEVQKIVSMYMDFAPKIKILINGYKTESKLATELRLSTQESSNILLGIVSVVIALLIAVISLLIATNIAQKIKQLNLRMRSLADGDTDAQIPNIDLKNELGDMAKSLLVFKENTIARVLAEIEKEKLTGEEQRKVSYVAGLIDGFQDSSTENISNVQKASEQLENLSKNLNNSAANMQNQSKTVTENVENTTSNVTSAASATEEMVASISEIAQQASLSTDIAEQARVKTNDTVWSCPAFVPLLFSFKRPFVQKPTGFSNLMQNAFS